MGPDCLDPKLLFKMWLLYKIDNFILNWGKSDMNQM